MIATLSQRLKEILQLKISGVDNAGIALVLGLAPKTVECQVSILIEKLGGENPWNATAIAIRDGHAELPAK